MQPFPAAFDGARAAASCLKVSPMCLTGCTSSKGAAQLSCTAKLPPPPHYSMCSSPFEHPRVGPSLPLASMFGSKDEHQIRPHDAACAGATTRSQEPELLHLPPLPLLPVPARARKSAVPGCGGWRERGGGVGGDGGVERKAPQELIAALLRQLFLQGSQSSQAPRKIADVGDAGFPIAAF